MPSSRTHFRRISLVGLHRMAFPRTRVMTLVLLCVVGTHGPHSPTLYLQEFPKDINSIELLSQSDVIWQFCLNFKDILLFNIIILNYMYYFSQEICHSFFSYSYLISHLTVTIIVFNHPIILQYRLCYRISGLARIRTWAPWNSSQVLYKLSYLAPVFVPVLLSHMLINPVIKL